MSASVGPALRCALIVDDNPAMRDLVIRTIRQCEVGIEKFVEAENGSDALGALLREKIDIVFLDIFMPVMGGEEFLTRLRALPKAASLPVIVTTGQSGKGAAEPFEGTGVWVLQKPWRRWELKAQVGRAVVWSQTLNP